MFLCSKFAGPLRAARPGSGGKMEISSSVFHEILPNQSKKSQN